LNVEKPILVDTDVLVDFLRGYSKAVAFINRHSARIILSSIVVAELYARVKADAEESAPEDFVSLFRVPVSATIARSSGLYKRTYSKLHGVGLADAMIAATAEAENAELKTINVKHYPMLKGLRHPTRNRSLPLRAGKEGHHACSYCTSAAANTSSRKQGFNPSTVYISIPRRLNPVTPGGLVRVLRKNLVQYALQFLRVRRNVPVDDFANDHVASVYIST